MKIKIELAGKEVELTKEEARALWSELSEVFSEKPTPFYPWPTVHPYPVYIDRTPIEPNYLRWEITCQS